MNAQNNINNIINDNIYKGNNIGANNNEFDQI